MPVHSREKKENNHDDMEVDYGENEGSSSEEEESESSSVSEEGDSSGEAGKGLLGAHARADLPRLGLDRGRREDSAPPRPALVVCRGDSVVSATLVAPFGISSHSFAVGDLLGSPRVLRPSPGRARQWPHFPNSFFPGLVIGESYSLLCHQFPLPHSVINLRCGVLSAASPVGEISISCERVDLVCGGGGEPQMHSER